MRDEKDSQTADMLPAKLGRPCLDSERGPLTPAERAKRYRSSRRIDMHQVRVLMAKPTSRNQVLEGATDLQLLELARAYLVDLGVGTAAADSKRREHLSDIFAQLHARF